MGHESGKAQKTNAARQLDTAGIAYRLIAYEVDENDLSAVHVAHQLGEDVERIFKTESGIKLAKTMFGL